MLKPDVEQDEQETPFTEVPKYIRITTHFSMTKRSTGPCLLLMRRFLLPTPSEKTCFTQINERLDCHLLDARRGYI